MKKHLGIIFLAMIALLCSCKNNRKIIVNGGDCVDIVQPANLKPIDWNGWNDAYTVGYTFYDDEDDACYDYNGDTILCYGHITNNLYLDYQSLEPEWIYLEGSDNQEDSECVRIFFDQNILQNEGERDSLVSLLNSSTHSDICFVKGIFFVYPITINGCTFVRSAVSITRLEDIHFDIRN